MERYKLPNHPPTIPKCECTLCNRMTQKMPKWVGTNKGSNTSYMLGWGEPIHTLVSWRQGFKHSTKNECMGWFVQIIYVAVPNLYLLFNIPKQTRVGINSNED